MINNRGVARLWLIFAEARKPNILRADKRCNQHRIWNCAKQTHF